MPSCLFYPVLGSKPRTSCTLSKHPTNCSSAIFETADPLFPSLCLAGKGAQHSPISILAICGRRGQKREGRRGSGL